MKKNSSFIPLIMCGFNQIIKYVKFGQCFLVLVLVTICLASSYGQFIQRVQGTNCVGSENVFIFAKSGCSVSWSISGSSHTILDQSATHIRLRWNAPATGYVSINYYNCSTYPYSGSEYFPSFQITNSVAPSVSITANQNNVCQDTNIAFYASPTNGGANPSYAWKVNGATISTGGNTFSKSNLVSGDVVSAVMTSNASCLTTSTATSNDVAMTFTTPSPVSVSVTGPSMPLCGGTYAGFSASVTNGGTSPTYTWYKNNGVVTDNSPGTPAHVYVNTVALITGDKIKCIVTSNQSCISGNPAPSNEITVSVTSPIAPNISISPSSISFCVGDNVTFTASTGQTGITITNYSWKLNGEPVGTNSNTYSTTQFATGSIVTVTTTSSGACLSTTTHTATTSPIPFTVRPKPNAGLSPSGSVKIKTTDSQLISGSPTGGGYSYVWKKNGGIITGITSATYTTSLAGSYTVDVSYSGCTKTSPALALTVNVKPTVNAGVDINLTLPTNSAIITGTATDTDGSISSYAWSQQSGPTTATLTNQNTSSVTVSTLISGNYVFRLVATDNSGESAFDDVTIIVSYPLNNFNQIVEQTVLKSGVTTSVSVDALPIGEKGKTTQYFDGLGRPMQVVSMKASPLGKDIVQPIAYDALGRESKKYLPYVEATATDGYFKNNSLRLPNSTGTEEQQYRTGKQYSFYQTGGVLANDQYPFAETRFEPSPLNRVFEQGSPGSPWQPDATDTYSIPADRSLKMAYEYNTASEVLLWTYTYPNPTFPFGGVNASTGVTPIYYPANQLYKNRTKDEQRNEVIEYKDKVGRVVLKRVQAVSGATVINDTNYASTYYIYDVLGSLVCVIPPEATARLATSYYQSGATNATKDAFLKRWGFRYAYDERRRMIQKHVPGAGDVYLVYDKRDRLVMTQDAVQRPSKKWLFTKYDVLNRPVLTGTCTVDSVLVQSKMQRRVNVYYNAMPGNGGAWFETYTGAIALHGYSNKSYPLEPNANNYLSVTYYDNYKFVTDLSLGVAYNFVTTDIAGQQTTTNNRVVGLVTGSKVNVLNSTNYLWNVSYYDAKYRAIQNISQNHKAGTIRTTNVIDFPGRVWQTKRTYLVNGATTNIKETFDYDHASRLKSVKHSTNDAADVMIIKNAYNELGQLVDKNLHSTDFTNFKQSVDYRYNIRGWLTKMNESDVTSLAAGETLPDYFGMELAYNNALSSVSATAQYNGNISAVKWSSGLGQGTKQQAYSYGYDPLNRLLNSNHHKYVGVTWTADISNQETGFSYDLNGNIGGLIRKGALAVTMDNLAYGYTGNQLNYVHDTADPTKGFINQNTGIDDYSYDLNGNLTLDKNKGITTITYNHLNLPVQVNKGATDYVVYNYDASGRKLSQQVFGSTPKVTDYIGEYVYEGATPVLKIINHAEGRVLPDGANWEYQYHLKDHLGNVRVTFTAKTPVALNYPTNFETDTNTDFTNYNFRSAFDLVDHTDAGTASTYVQTLTGGINNRVGVAKSISVMPGDQVTISAWAKYMSLTTTPNTNTLIASLSSIFGVNSSSTGEQLKLYNGLNSYAGTVPGGDHYQDDEDAPKAFVTILFFDKDYNFLDAAWKQITTAGAQTSATVKQPPHDFMSKTASAKEQGYAYVFVSNEHHNNVTLYFDDVTVTHTPSPIVSSSDYFAFGLTYNSYSRENAVKQDYKYNGKELQDELGINWLDYGARMYQPELGRFFTQDRFAEKYYALNPYQYAANNPLLFMDHNGDSLIVSGMSGNTTAVSTFESQVSTGLGGFYTLGKSSAGKYTLNATGQAGTMTKEQQAFYNVMNGVISHASDVSFTVVDGSDTMSQNVVVGDNGHAVDNTGVNYSAVPGTHLIDVGDTGNFSATGKVTAQGMIGHEIKEGFEIQTKGLTTQLQIFKAHGFGLAAENSINGNSRVQTPGVPSIVGGVLTINLLVPSNGTTTPATVTGKFSNGNITNVSGN